jgi:hypothetical protein
VNSSLQDAIEALKRAKAEKLREIETIDRALDELRGVAPAHARQDFAGLGIVEATKRYLREVNRPCSTADIKKALLDRGWTTRSKNPTATVYATLENAKQASGIEREHGRWQLRTTE